MSTLYLICGMPGLGKTTLAKEIETHYLDLSIENLWQRIQKRNLELPEDSFYITREELDWWMGWFTPPNEEEFKFYDEYEVHRAC